MQKRLNKKISDQIDHCEWLLLQLLYPIYAVLAFGLVCIVYLFFKQSYTIYKILKLFQSVKKTVLEFEINFLQMQYSKLAEYQKQFIDQFSFDLQGVDYNLQREIRQQETLQKQLNLQKKSNQVAFPRFSFLDLKVYLVLVVVWSLMYAGIIIQN